MEYTTKKEGIVTKDKYEDLKDTINNIQGWYAYIANYKSSPDYPVSGFRIYKGECNIYIPDGAIFRYEPATRKSRAKIDFQWDDYTLFITSSEDDGVVVLFKSACFEFLSR